MNAIPERKAAVAGQFYPREPQHLRDAVQQYIGESGVEPSQGSVVAIIVPHAGYIYSGPTAGHAFARLRNQKIRRVILLGCSHRYVISSASVYNLGGFETPLGTFPVDTALANSVANAIGASSSEPHLYEHSLEVQLPFVAVAVGIVPIVPILLGAPVRDWHARAGAVLADLAVEGDLLVVSTVLSHYLSEPEANAIDQRTLDTVMTKDWRALVSGIEREECAMCGAAAVVAGMAFATAKGAEDWRMLDYRTSAQASGDYNRVVGYGAVSLERLV